MQIQVRHDGHVRGNKHDWIDHTIQDALARYGEQVTTVEVHLADEDGPKNSDGAIRATIEVRLSGFNPIAATHHGDDVAIALDGALEKVVRILDDKLGRVRDHHANL